MLEIISRPETALVTIFAFKRGLLCNFVKNLKDNDFMRHSDTGLELLVIIDF